MAVALCAASCGARIADRGAVGDPDAQEYVQLVAAIGARDRDSVDYLYGTEASALQKSANLPSFASIRSAARALADRLDRQRSPETSDDQRRRMHLARQARAIAARADLLIGQRARFDAESLSLFGVTAPQVNRTDADLVRSQIARVLPGSGPLSSRYARFVGHLLVPESRQRAILSTAIAECRRRSAAHIALPRGEQVEIIDVDNSPWIAYSRYTGNFRTILELLRGARLTPDAALALACHETYPGHHLQNVLVEERLVRAHGWIEFTVQPLFSPQMLLAEGAATTAVDVAFPNDEREAFERDVLFPAAGLDPGLATTHVVVERLIARLGDQQTAVARLFVDGDLEFARASAALSDETLTPQPDTLLKFFNEYRSFAVTYTVGAARVRDAIAARRSSADPASAWEAYESIITSPWSWPSERSAKPFAGRR